MYYAIQYNKWQSSIDNHLYTFMALHDDIQGELKDALRAKDAVRLRTIRGMLTAFTNELVATNKKPNDTLPDDEVVRVITRLAKQRRESIDQFEKGGRDDLAQIERDELEVLERYLPEMMSRDEIASVVEKKKTELGITEKSDTGRLTGAVMAELKGKADGSEVKAVVEEHLSA